MRLLRITQIETQKRNENRVNVYLDGVFAFGLNREVLIRNHLHEGDELSREDVDTLLLAEEIRRAKDKALAILSYRDRSILELSAKLAGKHFSEWVVDIVIKDFLRVGLLDDSRFAKAFTHSKMVQKPVAKRMLMQYLKIKGIEGKPAEQAVEDAYRGRSEAAVAGELARKRFDRLGRDPGVKVRKKISDFLARRGFSWETINAALSSLPDKE